MALIQCPECGKENISDSAEACPNCGYGIKAHFEKIEKENARQKRLQARMDRITMPKKPELEMNKGFFIMPAFFCLGGLVFIGDTPIMGWTCFILALIFCIIGFVEANDRYVKELDDYNLAMADFEKYQKQKIKEQDMAAARRAAEEAKKIHCPNCNSTNVEQISTTSRVASVAAVGVASSKIGKQYKCKNCKHMW